MGDQKSGPEASPSWLVLPADLRQQPTGRPRAVFGTIDTYGAAEADGTSKAELPPVRALQGNY